jgi:hypothetical protein
MLRNFVLVVGSVLVIAGLGPTAEKYAVKEAATPVPKEVPEAIKNQLGANSIEVVDDKGEAMYELWFRKELPVKATGEQIKNGLTYQEIPETTLVGIVRIPKQITDYRKQKIKAGVFTLRFGLQPMDGDHMGTAPYREFFLLAPADKDKNPDLLADAKAMQELSYEASGKSHPAIFLLVPPGKPPAAPQFVSAGNDNWVLRLKVNASADGQKAEMGLGLTLIGHTTAE